MMRSLLFEKCGNKKLIRKKKRNSNNLQHLLKELACPWSTK